MIELLKASKHVQDLKQSGLLSPCLLSKDRTRYFQFNSAFIILLFSIGLLNCGVHVRCAHELFVNGANCCRDQRQKYVQKPDRMGNIAKEMVVCLASKLVQASELVPLAWNIWGCVEPRLRTLELNLNC